MGEVSDEGDEELATSVETDRIRGVYFEGISTVIESLDELKHGICI